jgi:hypothetical protein
MSKLGVIVPYRDRYTHLLSFKASITKYLKKKDIDFELIVIEQDGANTFNRGMLLNIGFTYAEKLKCDYVAFHDVDMLPIDVDYSYSDIPVHLATNFVSSSRVKREVFDDYFGGVTIFPIDVFRKINGYSNKYWGWGFEDNDLLYRCQKHGVPLDKKEVKNKPANNTALKFNGTNSYVKCKNVLNARRPLSIFVTFYPSDTVLDHTKEEDIYGVIGIPGYDFLISYSSYRRYSFNIFDFDDNPLYINSDIKINYKTSVAITIDPKTKRITMYQDCEFLKRIVYKKPLMNYIKEPYFYIGCASPTRETNQHFFNGLISEVAVYHDVLEDDEIRELAKNKYFGLANDFGEYKSSGKLSLYYDSKFIKAYKLMDLSGKGNDGEIHNCEIVGYDIDDIKIIETPFRRDCTFKLLDHDENGYINNKWRNKTTRYNQLRFENEVSKGYYNTDEDGLSNLQFVEHSNTKVKNNSHIIIGI